MAYPFIWKPNDIIVTSPSQVTVFNSNSGLAVFDVGVVVALDGTISFSLAAPGRYRVKVREGFKIITGTFSTGAADIVKSPTWITYEVSSADQGVDSSGNPIYGTQVTKADLASATIDQRAFAIAMAIAL